MCRWYSGRVFRALDAVGYSWVIRVDDDSLFAEDTPDLVATMVKSGASYGFRSMASDHPMVIQVFSHCLKHIS